jgi:hypothetical protein
MFITLPPSFPTDKFQEFGLLASVFFPKILSDEDLNDPLQRQLHFNRSWMAVAYRYRACAEHNEEFKTLLRDASELWKEWGADEEQNYKLEKCLYGFFTNGLSVFESLGYCLYFIGAALRPGDFPHVQEPKKITLDRTAKAFKIAFPNLSITNRLAALPQEPEFKRLDAVRNILAHRLGGRRHVRGQGVMHSDGTFTHTREEFWYIPGSSDAMAFDDEMIQRCLDGLTGLLTSIVGASTEFTRDNAPATVSP